MYFLLQFIIIGIIYYNRRFHSLGLKDRIMCCFVASLGHLTNFDHLRTSAAGLSLYLVVTVTMWICYSCSCYTYNFFWCFMVYMCYLLLLTQRETGTCLYFISRHMNRINIHMYYFLLVKINRSSTIYYIHSRFVSLYFGILYINIFMLSII